MTTVHRRSNVGLIVLAALALTLPGAARAQGGVEPNAQIQANGEDYAANELGNPWDMDSANDIAFEYTRDNGQISNLRFEGGALKGTSGADARVSLLLPSNPGVNPVLPEGGFRPIDTSKYRYLTVGMTSSAASFAIPFWQNDLGSPYEGPSGFQQVKAGSNVLTFDLAASGKWDGSVQGLYFDPVASAGISFEIDYIRLTTQAPTAPANTPPQITITSPSYISGPDYATTVVGNPWDMNDISDIQRLFDINNVSFSNGIMRGVNTSGDPAVALKLSGTIDTNRFKYLTYRFSIDGKIDTVRGSVARFIWWSDIPENSTTTRDVVVYEGFRTVSFDMTKIRTEAGGGNRPWLQSAPIVFRFDPHEFPDAHPFNIDYIMLTGDTTANQSFDIRYNASDADGGQPNVAFYFDTDQNPGNGNTAITCGAGTSAKPAATNPVFIPYARSAAGTPPPVSPSGATCRWNTANVPNGSYYIYSVASDGTDSVGRYSETPVVVRH